MARPSSSRRSFIEVMTAESTESEVPQARVAPLSRADFMTLTKARLSALVVITTLFGYLLGCRGGPFDFWILLHTLFGTTLCAFAAAVYNQILEMDADAKMQRTAERPLPARRMTPEFAFVLGWLLAAVGILHLLMQVNLPSASIAAGTIAVYIFIYTPLKTRSTTNTLVGAVSGALPPLIGWVAAERPLYSAEALFLFGLLFFWQLPHFLAINWMYRDQYEHGGFVMWCNGDETGAKTGRLTVGFSALTFLFLLFPYFTGHASLVYLLGTILFTGLLLGLSVRFFKSRERTHARQLFFYTLLYLPVMLAIVLLAWH